MRMGPDSIRKIVNNHIRSLLVVLKERTNLAPLDLEWIGSGEEAWHSGYRIEVTNKNSRKHKSVHPPLRNEAAQRLTKQLL